MKTILNTDRLKRLTARIPPRWAADISPATAPSPDAGIAQPAEFLPRDSARRLASSQKCFVPEGVTYVLGLMCYLCARFIPSEVAVWRPIWCLRNKERVRYENPLMSANSHFSPLKCRVSVPDVARASRRAASASGPTSPRHSPYASKPNEVMAGLSRAAAVRW